MELTIALGLTLTITAAAAAIADPARALLAFQPERSDLAQRLRVGVDTLTHDLVNAGVESPAFALSRRSRNVIAVVLPFRRGRVASDPPGTFRSDIVTVINVPASPAQTVLAADAAAGAATLRLARTAPCGGGVNLCGFVPGTMAVIFDDSGVFDLVAIGDVLDSSSEVVVDAWDAGSAAAFRAGATIVEARVRTYYLKNDPVAHTSQVMRADGAAGGDLPVLDHVVGLDFDYADEVGTALTSAELGDGPWLPNAVDPLRWDADLLRIRTIGVTLRVEAALAALRGPTAALFRNPGTSRSANAWMPDQTIRFRVSPRSLADRW